MRARLVFAIGVTFTLGCSATKSTDHTTGVATSTSLLPPGIQSPVPPDGACTATPGQATTLFTGNVTSFAVDDGFVYVGESATSGAMTLARVPIGGDTPQSVPIDMPDAPPELGGFALGGGAILFETTKHTLSQVPVGGDPMNAPTYARGLTFDGVNAWTAYFQMAGQAVVAQLPIDGSAPILTPIPIHSLVNAMTAGVDGLYLAIETIPDSGQGSPFDSIIKVPRGGGAVSTLATQLPHTGAIAIDDSYVYFSSGPYSSAGEVSRVAFDGSGLTTISTPLVMSIAVDAHAIYAVRAQQIIKIDKATGVETKLLDLPESGGGPQLLVRGGNLYWGNGSGGAGSGPTIPGGVWTTCK